MLYAVRDQLYVFGELKYYMQNDATRALYIKKIVWETGVY